MKTTTATGVCTNLRNILLTCVNGSEDNVMMFTHLTVEQVTAAFSSPAANPKVTWADIAEVPDRDVQYYLYDGYWPTAQEEAKALDLASVNPPKPKPKQERQT